MCAALKRSAPASWMLMQAWMESWGVTFITVGSIHLSSPSPTRMSTVGPSRPSVVPPCVAAKNKSITRTALSAGSTPK